MQAQKSKDRDDNKKETSSFNSPQLLQQNGNLHAIRRLGRIKRDGRFLGRHCESSVAKDLSLSKTRFYELGSEVVGVLEVVEGEMIEESCRRHDFKHDLGGVQLDEGPMTLELCFEIGSRVSNVWLRWADEMIRRWPVEFSHGVFATREICFECEAHALEVFMVVHDVYVG